MRAFAHLGVQLIHLAYLDEFGHVGPYVSRSDRRHNDSPVFGFAGFVMPVSEVRAFGTWFFQRKRELLDFEIRRSGKHPAVWEKKGSSLYRAANLSRYRGLRKLTGRLLARIERSGGYVFHAGIRKTTSPGKHDANALYSAMLRESIGRLDAFCREDCDPPAHFLLALDEHPRRAELLTAVGRDMYGGGARRRSSQAALNAIRAPEQLSKADRATRASRARTKRRRCWVRCRRDGGGQGGGGKAGHRGNSIMQRSSAGAEPSGPPRKLRHATEFRGAGTQLRRSRAINSCNRTGCPRRSRCRSPSAR